VKEEMQARVMREWKKIESINREARLMVKSSTEVISINLVLFEKRRMW
jgi:hypothetical protein